MSVDNVVRHYRQSQAKELLARLEKNESKPHTLALKPGLKEFIVRIQLSHEHHYNQIHELLEKSDFSRTITTRDGLQRDLPHAMFYRSVAPETGSREVFAAVVLLLEEHAKLHSLRDLNPQILVMDAKDVYLDLDRSKHP